MGVDWNKIETWQRLVAAMYASGEKPNLKRVALYFGTTYDTLENRMRKIKKDAEALKAEKESGGNGEAQVASTRAKPTPTGPHKSKGTKRKAVKMEEDASENDTGITPLEKDMGMGDADAMKRFDELFSSAPMFE